jgi:hypothetical protein
MAWRSRLLVVANETATSNELRSFLLARQATGAVDVTLLVAAAGDGRDSDRRAEARLAEALEYLRNAGIEARGLIGDADPYVAACEAYHPAAYDEIVISTLPLGASMWLANNTPQRVQHTTGALVTHVMPNARPMSFA